MKFLWMLLPFLSSISAGEYNFEPILRQENVLSTSGQYKFGFDSASQNVQQLRNSDGIVRGSYSYLDDEGQVQYMEYIAGPDGYNVYRANLPVTVASVTETPEVKAAREAHEEAYNYLQSVTATQTTRDPLKQGSRFHNTQLRNNFDITTSAPFYRRVDSTTSLPPLMNKFPLKNYFEAIEIEKKPSPSNDRTPSYSSLDYRTNNNHQTLAISSTPSVSHSSNRNYYKSTARAVDPVQVQAHKVTPEGHLLALKKAIAAQLTSFKNEPSDVSVDNVSNELRYQPSYRTELRSPVEVKHYSNSAFEQKESKIESNRKLAVIAATRALMKILNGRS